MLKLPGGRGRGARIERQVQGVDVMPTLLEAMGVPLPADLAGRPLQRALESGEPARPALAEISHRGFVAHGVRTEQDKFVRRFSPDDDELLFDLRRTRREDEHRRGAARAGAAAQGAGRGGHGAEPLPLRAAGARRAASSRSGSRRTAGSRRVETSGLGPQERSRRGRQRALDRPRAAAARRRAARGRFTVRPIGAPVTLSGLRDGRPLRPADVGVGEGAQHPEAGPLPAAGRRVRDRPRPRPAASSRAREARGRRRRACGWRCRRAARSASSTRRPASG